MQGDGRDVILWLDSSQCLLASNCIRFNACTTWHFNEAAGILPWPIYPCCISSVTAGNRWLLQLKLSLCTCAAADLLCAPSVPASGRTWAAGRHTVRGSVSSRHCSVCMAGSSRHAVALQRAHCLACCGMSGQLRYHQVAASGQQSLWDMKHSLFN
jgi:hypothetical protein